MDTPTVSMFFRARPYLDYCWAADYYKTRIDLWWTNNSTSSSDVVEELDILTWEGWLLPVVIRGTAASGSMVWFSVASFLHQTDVKQLKVRALTWPLVWGCVDFLCAQTKASVRVKEKLLVKYEVLLVMSSVTLTLIALGAQSAWHSAHGCTLTVRLCGKEPLLNASTVNIM